MRIVGDVEGPYNDEYGNRIIVSEKTLFEKDNLDVIITNLESDHIYGSFNNLKKSKKK